MNSEKTSALFEFIDGARGDMVALQKILTARKALSPENGGDGEMEKCEALEEFLRGKFSIAPGRASIERFDATDERVGAGKRPNAVLSIPGESHDFSFWIMSHLDTVPSGDISMWRSDPWEAVEKDGKIFGRGVEDNQQGIVSSVFAALAFEKTGAIPSHDVKLLFMSDEETGSDYGVKYLLRTQKLFGKKDVIVIPDGGDKNGETIEIAEKNVLWLRFTVAGRQSHGSRPDMGANACLAASALAVSLHSLSDFFGARDDLFEPPSSTFEPTMREANVDSVNIIPGSDVFCMDCRILPKYGNDEILREVDRRCRAVEKERGVKVSREILQSTQSPATSADSDVARRLARAIKDTRGLEARVVGIGGGTVAAALRAQGFDAAVWSSLDETAHQANEYCEIKNMAGDAKTLAALFAS